MKKILLFLGMLTQVILVYSAPDWSVNSSEFEYSLTITGIVEYDGIVCSEGDLAAAFVNGECRGVARSVYEESMDKYYIYLTVFSNTFSGEQVSFKYYNASQDITFDEFDVLEFEEGLNLGSVSQPYMITETVSMDLTYTLTFVVKDGTTAIEAADVTIDGTTVATDASGIAVFTNMVPANYDYTVTAAGYNNATGSVTLVDADITEPVSMDLTVYSISFTVNDGATAIEAAEVTINGITVATDASGIAVFTNMVPANYDYTVTAAGYNNAIGSVTLVDAGITEPVSMDLTVYSIRFTVNDGTNTIEGAYITIDGTILATDASGSAVFTNMIPANYDYTVTVAGYNNAAGSVTLVDTDIAEPVSMDLTVYSIRFTVNDGTDVVEGAYITIDGTILATDASGIVVFTNMVPAKYDYTVTAADFNNAIGSVTLVDTDIAEPVSMDLTAYSIRFTVNDGTDVVEGAYITIDGTILATDASGSAVFTNMIPANYDYTVTADGYNNAIGSVTLVDTDIVEPVSMTAISTGIYDVFESTISVYPNPATNYVNISFAKDIDLTIVLVDVTGRTLQKIEADKDSDSIHLDVSGLQTGLYFLTIKGADVYQSTKIIKK